MNIFLVSVFILAFLMITAKRITALINLFALQSFFLFLLMFMAAYVSKEVDLYVIAVLLLLLKVFVIPYFLHGLVRKIKIDESLGLLINPMLSLLIVLLLSYFSYLLAGRIIEVQNSNKIMPFAISLSVMLAGLFIMVFRMKAVGQVIGLLVMENGLFLTAVTLCGNMPFFVEIAIFFDVFVCAIILGIFVYKINQLFTHIDVDRLTSLKG